MFLAFLNYFKLFRAESRGVASTILHRFNGGTDVPFMGIK